MRKKRSLVLFSLIKEMVKYLLIKGMSIPSPSGDCGNYRKKGGKNVKVRGWGGVYNKNKSFSHNRNSLRL